MPALNPVRAENLNPDVLVMQPAKQGVRHRARGPPVAAPGTFGV